jgi:SEC-C motif
MDEKALALARAPTTRSTIESLAALLKSADAPGLAEEALGRGEVRAAVNLALAGALSGSPPPGDLVMRLETTLENTDLVIALFGSVRSGLLDALIRSSKELVHTPSRLGLILFFAASLLDGRPPPGELLRRIRLTSRGDLDQHGIMLVGLAALAVGDPDVLEVARDCVAVADTPFGRKVGRELLEQLHRPLRDALPAEPPPDFFGGFTIHRDTPRTGRNEPCPCGSGKKFKRCCLSRETSAGPATDPAEPWGGRVRFHASMTEGQFRGLHPLETARVDPRELSTARLTDSVEKLTRSRIFDAARSFLGELDHREDRPEKEALDKLRVGLLNQLIAVGDLEVAAAVLASFEHPDDVPDQARVALAIAGQAPDALDRIEAMADRALREESDLLWGELVGVLIYYRPALGILLARGTMDPATPLDAEATLGLVEEARDILLLPPHDPAWEIFDLLSERHVDAQLRASALEQNEQLEAEADELRRAVAGARARERSTRMDLDRKERELATALSAAEEQRARADHERDSGEPSREEIEEVSRLRRKVEDFKVLIAEGKHEQRELRHRLSRLGSRIDAAVSEGSQPEADDDPEGLEYEGEHDPKRHAPRIPLFTREFREGLSNVADHVTRDALATAGALAATDPGAWSSVKHVRSLDDMLSCRLGRHRALFRLVGEDEIEFCRLIHRRDLETTLKKMG